MKIIWSNIGFNTNPNTQEPYKNYVFQMKDQNCVTKGSAQNLTVTLKADFF